MTSVEIPYSIACALPSLTVVDITNDVAHEVAGSGLESGIAYITSAPGPSLVRINERECGFFEDLECLLERLVPLELRDRERILQLFLGPRTEQVPFTNGRLHLGTYQRVLLFSFTGGHERDWTVTLIG